MTPIERFEHLKLYWKTQKEERYEEYQHALKQFEHWSNKLIEAEIAEKLAKDW